MMLNRDISILVARSFGSDFKRRMRIADPMTGSGIRGLRYASEVAGTEQIFLNDIEPNAAAVAYHNSVINNLASKIDVQCMDANVFLNLHSVPGKRLHLIDLDPYGSPVPYMDSALRALINGGLLAMTATDMAVLCGAKPRTCYRRYGGRPLRSEYSREVALRLLLGSLIVTAAKHTMAVDVKLSHSTDHYVRTYVKVSRSAKGADKSLAEMGYISHCFNCLTRTTFTGPLEYNKCTRCDRPTTLAGPIFLGRLVDEDFCKRLIDLHMIGGEKNNRLSKLLLLELEEANSPPTFYTVDAICDRLGLATPSPNSVIEGLKNQGHVATRTHFDGRAFKTNASVDTIEALIKAR